MTDPATREERIALVGVSWDAYVALRELDENRGVSMTFREGRLELVRPSFLHDRIAHLLRRVVHAWTEDSDVPIRTAGSPTLQNAELQIAAEPDESFYIRNEAAVRPFDVIDTSRQPLPDLVIDVELSPPHVAKRPIYGALAIPEVWCWQDDAWKGLLSWTSPLHRAFFAAFPVGGITSPSQLLCPSDD